MNRMKLECSDGDLSTNLTQVKFSQCRIACLNSALCMPVTILFYFIFIPELAIEPLGFRKERFFTEKAVSIIGCEWLNLEARGKLRKLHLILMHLKHF